MKESLEAFRSANQAIEHRDQKGVVLIGREAGALLTHLNSMPYNTSPSERSWAPRCSRLNQAVASQKELRINLQNDCVNGEVQKLEGAANKYQPCVNFTVPYAEVLAGILLGAGPNPDTGRSRASFLMAKTANPASSQLAKAMSSPMTGTTHILVEE